MSREIKKEMEIVALFFNHPDSPQVNVLSFVLGFYEETRRGHGK